MHVLVITPYLYNTAPGQRFRIEQWRSILEKEEVSFGFASFEDESLHNILYQKGHYLEKANLMLYAFGKRLSLLKEIKQYDAIFLHREAAPLGPPWIEECIADKGIPIIYDFDDAIFVPTVSLANRYFGWMKFPNKTAKICALSTHVTVGNQYLRDYALRYNRNVTVIPTTIDIDKYAVRKSYAQQEGRIVIGWSGSYSTVQYLDGLRRTLVRLHDRHPFQLHVIGTPSYELQGVEVQAKPWCVDTEVEDLQRFDVGVMPMPDDKWTRGKCALKALQYMGVGVPVVCSPVGVNCDIIRDGENGFLASSDDEWVEKLSLLIKDERLRERIGKAGRATVERAYSPTIHVPRLLQTLESVVRRQRVHS